jgi:hypothetical protein
MGEFGSWRVETYNLVVSGKHIRKATRVIAEDGRIVSFTELMPKAKAIHQAREVLARGMHDSARYKTTRRFVD